MDASGGGHPPPGVQFDQEQRVGVGADLGAGGPDLGAGDLATGE